MLEYNIDWWRKITVGELIDDFGAENFSVTINAEYESSMAAIEFNVPGNNVYSEYVLWVNNGELIQVTHVIRTEHRHIYQFMDSMPLQEMWGCSCLCPIELDTQLDSPIIKLG